MQYSYHGVAKDSLMLDLVENPFYFHWPLLLSTELAIQRNTPTK